MSRDSTVEVSEFESQQGRDFRLSTSSRPVQGLTQPSIQWLRGVLSARVKRPGREDDHSAVTNAEVKNTWICTSIHPHNFME
jgi:hypothetical protein